jgi:hypothetical protein
MKKIIALWVITVYAGLANGQQLEASKLLDLLSYTQPKLESYLLTRRFINAGTQPAGDTLVKTYEYRPQAKARKKQGEGVERNLVKKTLKETFTLTYQTTVAAEYQSILAALKKQGFTCEYEKDSSFTPTAYLYQHEAYSAEVFISKDDNNNSWYQFTFFKKTLPVDKELYFAEDLLEFTSHEYLVYYFGAKNVTRDVYYFAGNDIANCSVLFINTKRQVIFVWKDAINRRKIDNLMFGGQHKLKSQQSSDNVIAENSWQLKSGVHAGMPLFELRMLNEKNIAFCGGDAANPGLIFPESSGKVDFTNADVVLGCTNCNDEKFTDARVLYADKEMQDGRVLFVLIIALYPIKTGLFD